VVDRNVRVCKRIYPSSNLSVLRPAQDGQLPGPAGGPLAQIPTFTLPIANLGDRSYPRGSRSFQSRTTSLLGESLKVPMIQQLNAARNLAASIS
jgi:hypothetical protein